MVTPEKLNLGINHGISILLPTFLAASARRIGDSSCDAAITSLAGIKIQLYIKLSYIAPYLYLSRWYFLRFLPNPRAYNARPSFSLSSSWRHRRSRRCTANGATVTTRYIHGVFRKPQRRVNNRWRFHCSRLRLDYLSLHQSVIKIKFGELYNLDCILYNPTCGIIPY